jgi:hypothetical protein
MVRLMANLVQWPALMEYQNGGGNNNNNDGGGGDTSSMAVIPVEAYRAIDATITTMAILCYFAPTSLTWKR